MNATLYMYSIPIIADKFVLSTLTCYNKNAIGFFSLESYEEKIKATYISVTYVNTKHNSPVQTRTSKRGAILQVMFTDRLNN